jgi:Flp pilus assembly CpaE family ATPase
MSEHAYTLAPVESRVDLTQTPGTDAAAEPAPRGLVLAVVGSKGSPGASECAWSLAALADRRWPTVLVECDLLGGSLAFRLAADPAAGSLLGVANAVCSSAARELPELVERWLCGGSRGWPPTLLAPAAAQMVELPLTADAVVAAIEALALMFPLVVCDVGWLLDRECGAGRCHAAILERADAQLLVAGSRGSQLVAARSQLEQMLGGVGLPPTRLRIVLNSTSSAAGVADRLERARFEQDLAAYGLAVDCVLPADTGGLARASRAARPLVCARRRSGYRRALGQLLEQLFVGSPPKRRLQRTRLRLPAARDVDGAVAVAAVADGQEEVVLPWSSR